MICNTVLSFCFKTHDFRFQVLPTNFREFFRVLLEFCCFHFAQKFPPNLLVCIASHVNHMELCAVYFCNRNGAPVFFFFFFFFFCIPFGSAVHSWSRGARCWIDWRRCLRNYQWWHFMGMIGFDSVLDSDCSCIFVFVDVLMRMHTRLDSVYHFSIKTILYFIFLFAFTYTVSHSLVP